MTFLQKLSTFLVITLFSIVLVLEVVVQPEYDYADFPYFDHNSVALFISVFAVVVITGFIMLIGNKLSWNSFMPLAFYLLVSVAVLLLVPMIPVSDQGTVYEIAANDYADPNEYMNYNSNVIPSIIYTHFVLSVLGKSIWAPKAVNVLCGFLSLVLMARIYGLISGKKEVSSEKDDEFFSVSERKMLWLGAIFLPVFLYNNHIYNEVPAVTLSLLTIYLVIKDNQPILFRAITVVVSCLQFVLRQSGIIIVIAATLYIFFYLKHKRYAIVYFVSIIAGYLLLVKCGEAVLGVDTSQSYPIWSFIKMGVNDTEFGFQDNTHAPDVTLRDCLDRYREYGLIKVLTIYLKKTYWVWGEGTFMAGRYGYGWLQNKYLYETFVTKAIFGIPEPKFRIITKIIMRAQYLFYMFLAVVGTVKARKNNRFSILFFIVCGFLCFYILWEIKSRYLYGVYPIFLIMAMYGWDNLPHRLKASDNV